MFSKKILKEKVDALLALLSLHSSNSQFMKPFQPYQPLLLRLLHGFNGLFVIGAILTAFWTYNTYDGRWGRLPLPRFEEIEGIHGTFGLWALLLFPFFALYSLRRGSARLIQPNSLEKLGQLDRPIGWYTLHRLANTLALLALTFALFSGKMMSEKWLPQGELNHGWYYAHLLSWVVLVVCIALHLLMSAKVGGMPLLLSIWRWRYLPQESPTLWWQQVQTWWQNRPLNSLLHGHPNRLLKALESLILGAIVAAWVISLIKESSAL